MYVCCAVAYDGTEYRGFQYQPDAPSIQNELEVALAKIAQVQSRVVGAGRTDTGVHANGQVVAVHLEWRHAPETLQRAWNAKLPQAIHVYNLRDSAADFHPRFSALHRTYCYTVCCPAGDSAWVRSPLTDRYALFERQRLNLKAMQRASRSLIGEHDFATFGQPTQGDSTTRHVYDAGWTTTSGSVSSCAAESTEKLVLTIRANGFLRHMVRNIVGSLLEVGRERWAAEHVGHILRQKDRALSAPPAPPQGLVLDSVGYPPRLSI